MSASAPLLFGSIRRRLAALLLSAAACRSTPAPPVAEPEPPLPRLPSYSEMVAELTPLDLSPDPLPEGVTAAVDGEPIFEAEVERIAVLAPEGADPTAVLQATVLQLVERRLLQAKADQMDVRASEDEVQRALDEAATAQGLTVAQLEAEVEDGGVTWDEYREGVIAQIVEVKVLDILGVFGPGSRDEAIVAARRSRVVGCMRARAEVQVRDDALALPDNPFALVAKVDEFRFVDDVVLPEAQLRAAARGAARARVRLCDALNSAELAVQELYLERGYLEADVRMPWPDEPAAPVTIDVRVTPGRPHVVGTLAFDQSAVPRRQRLDVSELRTQLAGVVTTGDVASMSALREAEDVVARAFGRAGLGPVSTEVERVEGTHNVRVDITYRLSGAERG